MAFFHGNTIGQGVVIGTPFDLGTAGWVLQSDGAGGTVWAPPGGIDLAADYPWTGSHSHTKPLLIDTDDGPLGPRCLDVNAVAPSPLRVLFAVSADGMAQFQVAASGVTQGEIMAANVEFRSNVYNTTTGVDLSLQREGVEKLALKDADAVFLDNVIAPTLNSVAITDAGAGDLFLANDGTYKTPPSGGGGEANTGSNVGAGVGVFQTKVGVDLRFRSLVSDGSVGLAENADTITITATAASVGADPAGTASATVAAHDADSGAHGGVAPALAAHIADLSNPHNVTAAQVGALTAVEDDPSPKLGGDLAAPGTLGIIFRNQADDGIVAAQGTLANDSGVYLGLTDDGTRQADWAALDINAGGINLYGSSVAIESLSNSVGELREVWADDNGVLFAAAPPDPGWSEFANDANNYDLGTGTGVGPWVKVADCEITIPVDVPDGSRLDLWSNVDVVNKTTNRSGTISFGFGIDGNAPLSPGEPRAISPGFAGYIPTSLSTKAHGGLVVGQTVGLWSRRESGSNNQFGVDLVGGIGDEHELIVSVPAEGGGGGSGDVLQGTGGTTGEVVVWQNFAAKTVHGTGLQVSAVSAHISSTSNPHGVTAAQAGADPVGSAALVQTNLDGHVADSSNPHNVTAAQAGAVAGDGTITSVVKVTQAEYDALSPPDANTLYAIVG